MVACFLSEQNHSNDVRMKVSNKLNSKLWMNATSVEQFSTLDKYAATSEKLPNTKLAT